MGRKKDHRGRSRSEHHTIMTRTLMEEPAWRALSTTAMALYPWLTLEWKGPQYNNNGKIRLSVRQAAERLGIGKDTATRAFHELQAKGFISVVKPGCLGVKGKGTCHEYELTELGMPNPTSMGGRRPYKQWSKQGDFPVIKGTRANASGANRRKTKPCHHNDDKPVIDFRTYRGISSSK